MSPPHHISCSPLLPTTGLQVNTSSKPLEVYQYYRSPCHHLTIYLVPYYYLLQVYMSTRRQNPQKHTITTGHHVITSLFSTPTYYRSTGQHVVTTSPYILFSTTTYYRSVRHQNPQKDTRWGPVVMVWCDGATSGAPVWWDGESPAESTCK